ncbi:MAG: pitrilysin family protein, partial [Candidatus Zixiibacteriota bacterium]
MKRLYLAISLVLFVTLCLLNCGAPTPKGVIKQQLPNGLTVVVKSNPDSKVLGINILGKNRSAMEPKGKTGIADFTNRMLLKGTSSRSAAKISEDLSSIGADITLVDNPWIPMDDVYTTHSYTFIKFQAIDEFAEFGIELLSDVVKNPSFPEEEIEKVRGEMMMHLGRKKGSTRETVRDLFYATLFEDHPYSKPIMGTPRTIGTITRDDLVSFHKTFYSPNNMIVTVVTNLPADEMMAGIQSTFGDMQKVDFPALNIPAPDSLTVPIHAKELME